MLHLLSRDRTLKNGNPALFFAEIAGQSKFPFARFLSAMPERLSKRMDCLVRAGRAIFSLEMAGFSYCMKTYTNQKLLMHY